MNISKTLTASILCSLLLVPFASSPAHASAPPSGLDSTTPTLDIAVSGQTAIHLSQDTSGASPPTPTVKFTGPFQEGTTTVSTAGDVDMNNQVFLTGGATINPSTGIPFAAGVNVANMTFLSAGGLNVNNQAVVNTGGISLSSAPNVGGAINTTVFLDSANGNISITNSANTATITANGKQLYAFGGMYQTWICDTSGTYHGDGSGGCRIPNPITGSCSCPAGYSAQHINDFAVPLNVCPQAYYENRGMIEFWCM